MTEQELRDYGEVVKEALRRNIERVDEVINMTIQYKSNKEMSEKTKHQLIASAADPIGWYDFKMACLDLIDDS